MENYNIDATLLLAVFWIAKLSHVVIQVVGAGRGIGKELALQLCQFGVTVACVDINVESCTATVLRAQQLHGVCRNYQCDVRNGEAVRTNIYILIRKSLEHKSFQFLMSC